MAVSFAFRKTEKKIMCAKRSIFHDVYLLPII